MHDPGVLPGRQMRRCRQATGEQVMLGLQIRLVDPRRDGGPGRLGQLELHRPLRLSLDDHGSGQDLIGVHHVPHPQAHQITAAQLAVDCQVEHGQVADLMFVLQVESNGPDILWLERWLLAYQLAFVPGLAGLVGFHVRLPRSGWESDCVAEWRMAAFRQPAKRMRRARSGRDHCAAGDRRIQPTTHRRSTGGSCCNRTGVRVWSVGRRAAGIMIVWMQSTKFGNDS